MILITCNYLSECPSKIALVSAGRVVRQGIYCPNLRGIFEQLLDTPSQ